MTELHYYMINPTGNITALVDTQVPPAYRPFAALRIMEKEPLCEQVGFIGTDADGTPFLEMAGGEFCGNASMSAAALYCLRKGLTQGEKHNIFLRVSGAPERVAVSVLANGDGSFSCGVEMPRPERIGAVALTAEDRHMELPAVFFPGITHIISENVLTKDEAERYVRKWCAELGSDGLGIMLFDSCRQVLSPLVYVPAADTLFWESSCASGTSAVGAFIASKTGQNADIVLNEPGGCLRVAACENGQILLYGSAVICSEENIVLDIG